MQAQVPIFSVTPGDGAMSSVAHDLAEKLALKAEAVCRHYLSNGRKDGAYWRVGDIANTPGGSLFVKLKGPATGKGAAGNWTDAATGEYGDLLDLIRQARGLASMKEAFAEARAFLNMPEVVHVPEASKVPVLSGSEEAARRLWKSGTGFFGSLGEKYLKSRGITVRTMPMLRYHPACNCREEDGSFTRRSALLLGVSNGTGTITGVHRIYLDKTGARAPIPDNKRMLGLFLGSSARFGTIGEVAAAGEGLETMLSVRTLMPTLPVIAGVSAPHLVQIPLPPGLKRLYITLDNDTAGRIAAEKLLERAHGLGIACHLVWPTLKDWNDDLRELPRPLVRANLLAQIDAVDRPKDIAA